MTQSLGSSVPQTVRNRVQPETHPFLPSRRDSKGWWFYPFLVFYSGSEFYQYLSARVKRLLRGNWGTDSFEGPSTPQDVCLHPGCVAIHNLKNSGFPDFL